MTAPGANGRTKVIVILATLIVSAGMLVWGYQANRVAALEHRQAELRERVTRAEENYKHIHEVLIRMEDKMDRHYMEGR